jgi:phosphoenolpyruvate-protein kinase (PTS system EI component)
MKRTWTSEELLEHFTLLPDELNAVGNKSGATRLGFAVLFKCFRYEGRFLRSRQEAAPEVVRFLATQVGVDSALFAQYAWEGRTIEAHRAAAQWRNEPGSTADGYPVQIFANIGDLESARAAAGSGAEGIGLLRTEFLFGGRSVFPDEQEQFDTYVTLFRAFADHASFGKTIIARTLDAGADKPFPALEPLIGPLQEANPALGLRGARIHLVHEELLRQQLRALLRAGAEASIDLHIMFPMIATLEEVRRLRTVYTAVQQELQQAGLALPPVTQIGIMVETPAAAVMADALAREVDFFSIGANDLFQYTMAADRTNSRVTSMFGTLEPAVWHLIDQVVRAARSHNKTVALCGELAANPRIGP